MLWLVGLGAFAVLMTLAGKARGESLNVSNINTKTSSVVKWSPAVQAIATLENIPWQFAMAWLAVESGGNVCAYGVPSAKGPDGQPQELGLFQLYNPDDLKRFGATGAELRAYCVPGTQKQSRELTPEELGRHIKLGIQLIKYSAAQSGRYMAESGISWPTSGKDYWRAVKLWHALPVIVKSGFASVTKKLGHPPRTWSEFRKTYETINPRARFVPGKDKQDGYYRALDNAEKTGEFAPEKAVG